MATTLRGILGLPERVADRYVYEKLVEEDLLVAALPGDDITNHPGNNHARNPFFKYLSASTIVRVRRMYREGKFDQHLRLKKYAEQFIAECMDG